MEKWTVTDIAARFDEAARTLRRLPPVRARGYYNTWPPIVRTVRELLDAELFPLGLGPPSAATIDRLEETMGWILLLDDEEERRLVWLRAERVRWRKICTRIGCGRTKAWQMWVMALLKIATRLNG